MVTRVVALVCAVTIGTGVGVGCSYTKKDDSAVVPSPTTATVPVVPSSQGAPVIGTLPLITTAPTTTLAPVPASPVTTPPTTERAVAVSPQKTAATTPKTSATTPTTSATTPTTAAVKNGTTTVQAGSFSTAEAAQAQVAKLGSAGFGGFTVEGSSPYRVVRGGLSAASAASLVQSLNAKGFTAYTRG